MHQRHLGFPALSSAQHGGRGGGFPDGGFRVGFDPHFDGQFFEPRFDRRFFDPRLNRQY